MDVMMMDRSDIEYLRKIASIIEFRCNNISHVKDMLESDIKELHASKSERSRDLICTNIYNKIEYIETLLSKNIDDIMSVEIIEMDKMSKKAKPVSEFSMGMKTDDYSHYIQ